MPRRLLLASLLLASGCIDPNDAGPELDIEDGEVSEATFGVTDAYVRAAPARGVGAVFFRIDNPSATPDTLIAAAADVSEDVQIHQTTVGEDGLSRMQPVDRIPVPAGATVALEPGGYHVMLLGLKRSLAPGDSLLLELTFSERGTLTPRVPVRALTDR